MFPGFLVKADEDEVGDVVAGGVQLPLDELCDGDEEKEGASEGGDEGDLVSVGHATNNMLGWSDALRVRVQIRARACSCNRRRTRPSRRAPSISHRGLRSRLAMPRPSSSSSPIPAAYHMHTQNLEPHRNPRVATHVLQAANTVRGLAM